MLSNKVHFPKTRIYEISVPKFGTKKGGKNGITFIRERFKRRKRIDGDL